MKTIDQLDLFSAKQERKKESSLPVLPKSTRYHDSFSGEFRLIKDTAADTWTLEVEGKNNNLSI